MMVRYIHTAARHMLRRQNQEVTFYINNLIGSHDIIPTMASYSYGVQSRLACEALNLSSATVHFEIHSCSS